MKRLLIISILLVFFLVFAGLTGCDMFSGLIGGGKSISERIDAFETDLNQEDRSGMYTHFHENTANRDQIADADVLNDGPLGYANQPFTLSPGTPEDSGTSGQKSVSVEITNVNVPASDPIVAEFIMQEDETGSGNWLIRELTMTYGGTTYTIRKIGM
jgi:hypothetical protein